MLEGVSDNIALRCVAETNIGGRPENQDDMGFLDTPLGFLCVICDGMGGGPGGKTASYIAKHEIINGICSCSKNTDRKHAFRIAVSNAQKELERKVEEVPALKGMGSTFVAILINGRSALVAHAGDSRCYQIRGKKCIFKSNDHSLVAELVQKKVLTEEEARKSPQSNVITRGLGSVSNQTVEFDELSFKHGDRFILCTDGIWGAMPNNDLMIRFYQHRDISKTALSVSSEVNQVGFAKGGEHDNHTIAIIDVMENSELKEDFKDKIKRNKSVIVMGTLAVIIIVIAFASIKKLPSLFHVQDTGVTNGGINSQVYQRNEITVEENKLKRDDTKCTINTDSLLENQGKDSEGKDSAKNCERVPESAQKKTFVISPAAKPKEANTANVKKTDLQEVRIIVQRIINCMFDAEKFTASTPQDVQVYTKKIRERIKEHTKSLCSISDDASIKKLSDDVESFVEEDSNWFVDKEMIGGKYMLTGNCRKRVSTQIKNLQTFKKKI